VVVQRIEQLSPHMVRVTLGGEQLASFEWRGPAGHLKLIVPPDGVHEAPMPLPDGSRAPNTRTYTPRRFDAERRELDVDLVLHDEGPAGRWASRAQVGDRLVVMGPAQGYQIDAQAPWFLLVGDDSALPAIETILAELPADAKVQVFVEVVDDFEVRTLQGPAQMELHWLPRGEDARQAGLPLEAALRAMGPLPEGDGRIYVACEAAAMRRIRDHFLRERGVERERLVTRGYWKLGAANHPDRDYGEDPA
jgi:NADPH-dependent ferric siderophore reductase